MFCPECRCEFRSGFTRCASCNVDLVERLPEPRRKEPAPSAGVVFRPLDFCGFLSLEEAREARDRLRAERIGSEIVIREQPGGDPSTEIVEEYWLRIDRQHQRQVTQLLGLEPVEEGAETFACSDCGREVSVDENVCPACGARFEEG